MRSRVQQRLDCWADAAQDGLQVSRTVFGRVVKFFQHCLNGAAPGVSQHNHQPDTEHTDGELHAAHLGRCRHVARHTNDEEIAKPLVEHQLRWHP